VIIQPLHLAHLGYAALAERTWRADQGDHKFILRSSAALPMICEENATWARQSFVLHQFMAGHFSQGEISSFKFVYVRAT